MAVQSDISSISYTGNNSTSTSYAVPFVFLENSHLAATAKVTATGVESVVTLTNHTGAADPNGGTVRTAVAVPATSTLTIYRTVPATQTTTYQEGGDFPAASHERALDKLTMVAQQNKRALDRSLKVTEAEGAKNNITAAASTLIGFDASRQPEALTYQQVRELLSITGTVITADAGTNTFTNATARALAVPNFVGQLGTQRDTGRIYISTGTSAGNWSLVNEDITLSDLAAGFFTADADGRGKFASGFFTADADGRGKFASGFVNSSLLADGAVTPAKFGNGPVIQVVNATTTAVVTINTTIPQDDTKPQNTEGIEVLTATITPSKNTNKILIIANCPCNGTSTTTNAFTPTMALFRGDAASAISTSRVTLAASSFGLDTGSVLVINTLDSPQTASAVTYRIRVGRSGTTFYVNGGISGGALFDATFQSSLTLMEVAA